MGEFSEGVESAAENAEIQRLRGMLDDALEAKDRADRMRQEANRAVKRVQRETDAVQRRLDMVLSMDDTNKRPPRFATTTKAKLKARHGIPTIFLSDTHWGEVVNPAEIGDMNAYSTPIAEGRLQRVLENSAKVTDMIALNYDGVVVQLGGDMFSGVIHRELDRTNDQEIEEAIVHWTEQLAGFLLGAANHWGKVHVPAVVGNHGRSPLDRRMPGKKRAKTNIDYLLYRNVALMLKGDDRFTWQISESADTLVRVYDTSYLLYHGNDFHGGSGISGAMAPVMLGMHRVVRQYAANGLSFDWLSIGHFHQHFVGKGLIMNGSMKGYDEFAFTKRYEPERPSQAMWITTPENGLTFSMPIYCADRESEGW